VLTRLSRIVAIALVALGGDIVRGQAPTGALDGVDAYVTQALAKWHIAGLAVAVVKDDSIVYRAGFGVRHAGRPERIDANTIFAIGSNTKLFTAVIGGMLVDEGRLAWDDPVTKHLPWFQLFDPWVTREITFADVLSHRSGLGQRGEMIAYGSGYDRAEVIRRQRYLVPSTSFRSEFGYSNAMVLTAGEVEGAAAGTAWDDLVTQRIFDPLGMTSSSTTIRALPTQGNVATPHTLDGENLTPLPWRNIDNVAPAGAINSSVTDMARWLRFLLADGRANGRRLLSHASLHEIESPHTPVPLTPDSLRPSMHFLAYGLGVMTNDYRGVKVMAHTGGIDGMLSDVIWVPERNLGIVVLSNTDGHNALFSAIGQWILDRYLGAPAVDWSTVSLERMGALERAQHELRVRAEAARPRDAKPTASINDIAGRYRSEMYGDLEIAAATDGSPTFTLVGGRRGRLRHWAYDAYELEWIEQGPVFTPAIVGFDIDPNGRVTGLHVDDSLFMLPGSRVWENDRFARITPR
jgi:CubicO group peptidase (beta-lactamase class C family)